MKKIQICDSIMGSGKTSAAIRMMNEESDKRFIFVTPYLSEVDRVKNACRVRGFMEPKEAFGSKQCGFQKLLQEKTNIATTHALLLGSNKETVRLIQEGHYILILDEAVDPMMLCDSSQIDMEAFQRAGILNIDEHGKITWRQRGYRGKFEQEEQLAKWGSLYCSKGSVIYLYPREIFDAFEEGYVLTYMFKATYLKSYFDLNKMEYEYIGTAMDEDGYRFSPTPIVPEYACRLKEKVHILERGKINLIGKERTSLSLAWFGKHKNDGSLEELSRNANNFFRNICKAPAKEWMWSVYADYKEKIVFRRANSFVEVNARATNRYRDRRYLAYMVNLFPSPIYYNFFQDKGVAPDKDRWSLSMMVQWIWRSAIRDGKEITIYVPSGRMRGLLKG